MVLMQIVPRIAFYPSLLYNIVLEKLSFHNWYNRIDEHIILGALPFRHMTEQLSTEENVKGVITMNEEFETRFLVNTQQEWEENGIKQLRLDTEDFINSPTLTNIIEGMKFIEQIKRDNGTVYVHCKAGRTRSATIVACYIIQKVGCSPTEAVDFIRGKRSHILLRQKQMDSIEEFYNTIKNKPDVNDTT
ncbi:phosphatidylglycerophosphatase and protein-tyrosine phosphatase 1-like [Tubulanus polymorphus]|uniref:phosphatidylglycerophosphatase and protein-tyrosine phosphatase 1-like n=1 Tax=Tubulanus polymorphus TaxID=672921 RepID=UPI003DA47C92